MPRFMMFMQPNVSDDRWEPTPAEVTEMMTYNEELTRAGVLLALDGLHPLSDGARVRFGGGRATTLDGPFAEAKEVVGGYWIIQAGSLEEATEWARRCPARDGDQIEVRRIQEMSDFPEDVQAVAHLSSEPPEQTVAGS
ncbi:YciI family protein [Conexibacter arvalis]|uniref:YCII-related domain-containing protein n=1 Tax=Conexibacter arvalis TaxID=912552 RepID=A0A840I8S9_9ACTN|nr:YciI family protein [Conexibacter arvalis]MBB4660725.1 hypothetical protein [Conexibacter arvalis]